MSDSVDSKETAVVSMEEETVTRKRPLFRDISLALGLVLMGLLLVKNFYVGTAEAPPEILQEQEEKPAIPVVEATADELKALSGQLSVGGSTVAAPLGRTIEQSECWIRLETPYGDLIAVRERDTREFVFLQGTTLVHRNEIVLSAGADAPDWSHPDIEMQVRDGKVFGFTTGSLEKAQQVFPSNLSEPGTVWAPHSSMPLGYVKLLYLCQYGFSGGDSISNFTKGKAQLRDLVLADGQPILHALARSIGNEDVVEFLVQNGADLEERDSQGQTARDAAATDELRELLSR